MFIEEDRHNVQEDGENIDDRGENDTEDSENDEVLSNYESDDRDEGYSIESDEDIPICLVTKFVETRKSKVGPDGKLI